MIEDILCQRGMTSSKVSVVLASNLILITWEQGCPIVRLKTPVQTDNFCCSDAFLNSCRYVLARRMKHIPKSQPLPKLRLSAVF
jgi:hypothetical protein